MRRSTKAALMALLLAVAPTVSAAQPPDRGKPDKAKKEKKQEREDLKDAQAVVSLIAGGIGANEARKLAVDLGIAGQKELPPGIRKNLAKGKPLPPGISKSKAPSSLLGKLPKHDGFEWRMAGTDLLLVSKSDKVVSDVLKDVFK
jgi:hypothetical protein